MFTASRTYHTGTYAATGAEMSKRTSRTSVGCLVRLIECSSHVDRGWRRQQEREWQLMIVILQDLLLGLRRRIVAKVLSSESPRFTFGLS